MKVWIKVPYHLKTLWIFGGTELEGNPVVHVKKPARRVWGVSDGTDCKIAVVSLAIETISFDKLPENYFIKAKKNLKKDSP